MLDMEFRYQMKINTKNIEHDVKIYNKPKKIDRPTYTLIKD